MTKRERYLKVLRNESVDGLVWAPNFDYWLNVNRSAGTLPEKYRDMSRNDIVRAIGATIWNRAQAIKRVLDSSVRETRIDLDNGNQIHEYQTPIGTIQSLYVKTEGEHSSRFLAEHFVKDMESLRVMRYVVEATHYEPDYEPVHRALAETGDDGIVLIFGFHVPFIQFCKTDAGYMNGFYLWTDYRDEVDALINLYFKKYLDGYRILAKSPLDIISTGDNMDGTTISPDIFRNYAIPFYQEVGKIVRAEGKLFGGHWCGRTQNLLPMVPDSGLDFVEAIVTRPMADIELREALDMLEGKVILQGGIPAVLACHEGGTRAEFERYIQDVIVPLKNRRGFVLGMSDNVPPNADFSRIEAVAELIA